VKGRDGKALRKVAGRPAAIISFLEGIGVRRPQTHHCGAVGQALAEMHQAGRDFPMRRANALSRDGWRPLFEMSRTRADTVEPGLAAFIETELKFLESAWPAGLPEGVIHADLFPDNVFFLKGKLSGLIDFYFACNDLLAYDLAVCLNAWCFEPDSAFNITRGRSMIQAYENARKLEPEEREKLPILCRGAALRFLLTRLYDWLTVPPGALVTPKDPKEYLRKLRFHQRVGSAADYGVV
jgi:homoserine kinase type II